jgi:hypothetical protein
MGNEKEKAGKAPFVPLAESGHTMVFPPRGPRPVIANFEQGKTLCPGCGAKLSRDLEREREEKILAEESEDKADRLRPIGPFYRCGRCAERFLGAEAGPARMEKGSLLSPPR